MLRDSAGYGAGQVAAQPGREAPQVWKEFGDGGLQTTGLASARGRIGVVLNDLPVAALVEQTVEATVQARLRRFLTGQLDGRPWPGQR